MTVPRTTPNPGTTQNPDRSSKRVARKKAFAWFPWALLAALALLLALIFLGINALDDDGPDGPAGDSLGQVNSDGSGLDGADGNGKVAGTEGGSGTSGAAPGGPAAPAAPAPPAAPGAPAQSGRTAIAGLNALALVGGGGVAPVPAAAVATTDAKRTPGTAGTVLFATGSAEVDANGQQVVAKAVEGLRAAGAKSVEVRGYTDVVAGQQVNDPLSVQRAEAVATALRSRLPGVTVTAAALGQNDPVAPNDAEAGRQQNRRAAIVATG